MHTLAVIIEGFAIAAVFIECVVVFMNWRGKLHSYLFLSCIAILLNDIGYLFELVSYSEDSFFAFLCFSYFGRVWTAIALVLFIMELVKIRIPKPLILFNILLNIATYFFVVTTRSTELYYRDMSFEVVDNFPIFHHTSGLWHYIWDGFIISYILFGIYLLFYAHHKEKNPAAKKRLLFVILAILTESIFFIIQITHLLGVTYNYDITSLGYTIGAGFMLVAILKYNLLDTEAVAREFVVDELSEGIIAVGNDDKISFFNKAAVSIFPELNKNDLDAITTVRSSIENKEPIRINGRIYTPKANDLVKDGVSAGILYALTDDTEHFGYLEDLKAQKAIADAANSAKSAFLANMSHDIRTPINAILGMDEMILRESSENDIVDYATDIRNAGQTLLSLVNDILDFSKIEEGKMEIVPTQYDISSVINDLINMVRERARNKGLTLKPDADPMIPHLLYGDEIRIKQILINLLTNAVKYTEKGTISFSVSFTKCSEDEILLRFRVTDTGIGMKPEDLDKLFAPFARLEEQRNHSIEGTGLGMSIVKRLLNLMGSVLEVNSTYGKGSSFSFEIKQKVISWDSMGDISARYETAGNGHKEPPELFHAPDAKILIVDDTDINFKVIIKLLNRTQIQIDTAESGMEALRKAENCHYDLFFIDYMMPGMDGIETLQKLKELQQAKKQEPKPVYIVLTANAISGAREMYLTEGFDDYISKPVGGKRLEEILLKYLPEHKLIPVQEEEPFIETEDDTLPGWIMDIPGLNYTSGIENCGGVSSYLSILDVFRQTAPSKAEEIQKYFEEQDYLNYTIKVHALKSSSRIIGAENLSEKARELEEAGKAGNTEKINSNTDGLISDYLDMYEKLSRLVPDQSELKELDPYLRTEAFRTIAEIADSMDYGMMEGLLNDLKGYRLSNEDEKVILEISESLMELDWDAIKTKATQIIQ